MTVVTWRQQIDNDNIVLSSEARRFANGSPELRRSCKPIYNPKDGKIVGWLTPGAARSWNAMVYEAWREGVLIIPTSAGDTFRPLADQERIRSQRYYPCSTGKVCRGRRECLKQGMAAAACPGTSNHGKAGAVDFRRSTGRELPWMERNAKRFGWQWELASEEWHVHYMLGDAVTQSVLEHEQQHQQPTPEEPDMDAEDKARARHIEQMLVNQSQGGMVDWGAEGGDVNGYGITSKGAVLQVYYAGGVHVRTLVPEGQAVKIFSGPRLDTTTGEKIELQVELRNGKIRWLTFDSRRHGFPGPVLNEAGQPDPGYHLVEGGDGWHYVDVD